MHALSRIRTRHPSNQAAEDLRLRPHGHRYQFRDHVRPYNADFFIRRKFTIVSE
jgi:hypothetical protein